MKTESLPQALPEKSFSESAFEDACKHIGGIRNLFRNIWWGLLGVGGLITATKIYANPQDDFDSYLLMGLGGGFLAIRKLSVVVRNVLEKSLPETEIIVCYYKQHQTISSRDILEKFGLPPPSVD